MKRRHFIVGTAAAIGLGALPHRSAWSAPQPRVLASFSILQDIIANIAPSSFEITTLVPANADAHVFSPKPGDVRRVRDADLIFFNGLGFEGWMNRLIQSAGYTGQAVQATQSIRPKITGKKADPHAWQSLLNGVAYAEVVRDSLITQFKPHADEIQTRAKAYIEALNSEHEATTQAFSGLPQEHRTVITGHDAFAYFGDAYGIQFLAPQGWSTHSAPSAGAMARLIRFARTHQAKGIFLENISDDRQIEQIARESGAQVGGTLFSDALSGPNGPAPSYLAMFKHNAATILNALRT